MKFSNNLIGVGSILSIGISITRISSFGTDSKGGDNTDKSGITLISNKFHDFSIVTQLRKCASVNGFPTTSKNSEFVYFFKVGVSGSVSIFI